MTRQYCASTFCIDFKKREILLVYNKKIDKWLQPGGHIEELEVPIETVIRETFEETGIKINVIGPSYFGNNIAPVAVERYINKVGDMIDIQYLSIPLTKKLKNSENNMTIWYSLKKLESTEEVEQEIKDKVRILYEEYKDKISY